MGALPETWPDLLQLWRPRDLWLFLSKVAFRKTGRVVLPAGLRLNVALPAYVLLEFHNLPNGNYSKRITRGYSRGFDRVMLGEMRRGRAALAQTLKHCTRVADMGCGDGSSTAALKAAGVGQVLGIDASPYLLSHAKNSYPELSFQQGLAERTLLPPSSLDGISACYLFHELPPPAAEQALQEFARVLRPGGRLSLLEPSDMQFVAGPRELWRKFGWRGLYFRALAHFVNEPFVRAWHARKIEQWLCANEFELLDDQSLFPSRLIVAQRR
ncbi:class I SAM-dependent methyltransferase [Sinimarinibacterium sp. CAU 1509]|uniref:class I SAM-dependent methyltransferase n=1 Tax=Sinimarinibacterium sp. CAU 1509 TaxID=2562283 RepID=UPI00146BEE85|nr:class I SAM-dependent methyltransferase [Sinimarinibacterium sp. CAU 1509]